MRERESLVARIRQLRRARADSERPSPAAGPTDDRADAPRFEALEGRIAHLEHLVEGLQDSVHRETMRHGKLIAELQAQIEPGTLGAALNKDARDRGL